MIKRETYPSKKEKADGAANPRDRFNFDLEIYQYMKHINQLYRCGHFNHFLFISNKIHRQETHD